ncbi:uncharacterized protein METZ01_LOCUS123368, partial [marine metagenome]
VHQISQPFLALEPAISFMVSYSPKTTPLAGSFSLLHRHVPATTPRSQSTARLPSRMELSALWVRFPKHISFFS